MRKIMIFLCFVLLMVIAIFSGCTSTQKISTSGTPPTPKIEYETVLVSPTPSLQMVYDTVAVPVTIPVTAQATISKGVEQFTANIQMIGNVYGIASTPSPSAGIDRIKFSIGLAPNSPPIDLINTKIVFSTESTTPKILTWDTRASIDTFTTKLNGFTSVTSLNANDPIEVTFDTAQVPANTKIIIELKPEFGASFSFSKTTPTTISAKNVLY
jgi:archaellin